MSTIEDVGTVIHVLRVIQDLSQGQLAEAAGVRNSSISNYERGKAVPKLETLQKLARGMGLELSALEETQHFIHRMRAQAGVGVGFRDRPGSGSLLREGEGGSGLDPEALVAEVEQLSGEAGRFASRLVRVLLELFAADALETKGGGEAHAPEGEGTGGATGRAAVSGSPDDIPPGGAAPGGATSAPR